MPTMSEMPAEKAVRLAPRDVQGYVRSRGWQQFERVGNLMVFNWREPSSLDQVLVPIDPSRPDFAERMWDAVEKLAGFERRPAAQIITDLQNYDADVLRYRVASPRTERGTLPLVQAIDLLLGAKQSLLAAAHSVLTPAAYHPRLSRTEARQLLDACQMNQTEQTSFVVAISCPLRAVDEEQAGLFADNRPFARRATSLLARSLAELDRAIEEDRINSIVDQEEPLVSANLCEALLKMRPSADDAVLEFLPSWAGSEPLTSGEQSLSLIRFSGDEFVPIEDIYRQLRPVDGPQAQPWIAFVDELKGTESASGAREGEVVLTLFDDDQLVRAKASLTKEQYQVAYEAHNPARPLVVYGQLIRGPRVSRLGSVTELRPALAGDVNT